MARVVLILQLLYVLLQNSEQKSTAQDDSYVGAVLEYEVSRDMDLNLRNYVHYIKESALQNADILVFPEMTLTRGTRSMPVPIHGLLKEHPIPALEPELFDEILVTLSAAAREHEIYVVVNLQEKMDCTNAPGEYCPEEKTYFFNTNVVFDRNGAIIDRYRKINLFGEFTRYPPLRPDLGVFSTDFGVKFGHFICFDIAFQVPAMQVVQKHNLTDVVYSTMWFSGLPYLGATQFQEAYAYAMNINFLASGANNVRVGSAGSGIYSGKAGALVSIMPGAPTTRLMVSRVPKVPGKVIGTPQGPIYDDSQDHDALAFMNDPSLQLQVSRLLVPGYQEFRLADKNIACTFKVRMNYRNGETTHKYRAFVYDGNNTVSRRDLGVVSCSIVACKNDDVRSCAFKFSKSENNPEIQELKIEMTTTYHNQYNKTLECDNLVYFSESFTIKKFPLQRKDVTYLESPDKDDKEKSPKHIEFSINSPQDELISFAIWGRLFTRDVDYYKEASEKDIQEYIELENGIFGIRN